MADLEWGSVELLVMNQAAVDVIVAALGSECDGADVEITAEALDSGGLLISFVVAEEGEEPLIHIVIPPNGWNALQ